MAEDDLCPTEITSWVGGDPPLFKCMFEHPDTVKPTNLDIILRDPLKVFIIRFFDSSKLSTRTHQAELQKRRHWSIFFQFVKFLFQA